jgi:hypothetical protein
VNATTGIRKQVLSTTVCKSIMMIINQWKFRRGKRKKGRCQVLRVTYKYYVWPTSTTCDLQVLRVTYKYYVWPTSTTCDLQAVHTSPCSLVSKVYYSRNLYLTIDSLGDTNAVYHLWDETQGKRGSCEIAICLMKNIMSVCCCLTCMHIVQNTTFEET